MKAVIMKGSGAPELANVPVPCIGPGDALVRVDYAGICKTDIKVADGALERKDWMTVLGHEFCGEVVKVGGSVRNVSVGEVVVANPMLDDVSDRMLGKDVDGCFAEYVAVPAKNLYIVDFGEKTVSMKSRRLAAYCEPVAAALGVAREVSRHDYPVIAGDSRDRIVKLIKFCILNSGYSTFARRHRIEVVEPEKLVSASRRFDCIVESCPESAGDLLKALAPRGTLILKSRGYVGLNVTVNDIVMREAEIVGAKYGDFYDALNLISARADAIKKMMSPKDFTLDDFEAAFAEARKSGSRKVMIRCAR